MYITQQTDYALRILIYIATHDNRATISEIADAYCISKNHLTKIIPELVKGNFINSVRGKGGGISLAKAANEIFIGQLVRYTESLNVVECLGEHNKCIITPYCKLGNIFSEAINSFLNYLDDFSLEDITTSYSKKYQQLNPNEILISQK